MTEEDNKLKTQPRTKSIGDKQEETKRIREEQEKIRREQEVLQSDNLKNMIPGRRGH
jgi:hypothetical protein